VSEKGGLSEIQAEGGAWTRVLESADGLAGALTPQTSEEQETEVAFLFCFAAGSGDERRRIVCFCFCSLLSLFVFLSRIVCVGWRESCFLQSAIFFISSGFVLFCFPAFFRQIFPAIFPRFS
jgi:hypothetical protein